MMSGSTKNPLAMISLSASPVSKDRETTDGSVRSATCRAVGRAVVPGRAVDWAIAGRVKAIHDTDRATDRATDMKSLYILALFPDRFPRIGAFAPFNENAILRP